MTINELKKQFLSQYIMSSETTKERIQLELDLFTDVCDIKSTSDLNSFNNTNMQKFYDYSKNHNWNPSTTNLRLATAKQFMSWAFKKRYIENNFLDDVKKIRTVNEVHYTPSNEDCEKLLTFIKEHTNKQRLYLMTKLMLNSGLRRSEICDLKVSDIDKGNFTIKVMGKGKKIVEQPIPNALLVELVEYINTERSEIMTKYKSLGGKDKGYVFVSGIGDKCDTDKKDLTNGNKVNDNSFYQQIKRFASKAGINNFEKISLHSLRRASATEIYNQTHDIKTTKEFLRHSNIATTEQCYVNFDRENVAKAVNERFEKNNEETKELKFTQMQNQNNFTQDDEYALYLLLKKKFASM